MTYISIFLAGVYVTRMAMVDKAEDECGTMSEKCESTFSDADINKHEVISFSPTSDIIKSSTGRKSFSKRRSACFGSLVNAGSGKGQNAENRSGGVLEDGATSASVEQHTRTLQYEKEAWQALCEERKLKYKEVKEHSSSNPLKLDLSNCADILLDEDKEFLNDQPNYENTVSKMNRVAEMAAICMHMKHKTACASNGIMEIAEEQGIAVKKKILKYAESYYT